MGILNKLLGPTIGAYAPQDDYWYTQRGLTSFTGVNISPETALCISTVFRCVSAIAQDIAAMPLIMYRRTNTGKERARNHPLYEVLHDQPNDWQTSFDWREMIMAHILLRGNAYCIIEEGPRGFADQLIPLNPARMVVKQLPTRRLTYTYTWENGRPETFTQDEIFHLRGLTSDGIVGLSVVALARESFGLGLATEQYGARFFGQGGGPGGVLQVAGTLSPEAGKRLEASWTQAHTGLSTSHKVAVLEKGTEWKQVGLSNEDAQFLSTRNFQIEEIARWFGVPLHRIGHTEKATSWGTGIEQFNLGYVNQTLMPWLKKWEQAIARDLLLAPKVFFAEFLMDHLMRGDTNARFNAYRTAITTGWMTRNEVRERENQNTVEGLDDFLVPQNMATIDDEGEVHPLNDGNPQPQPALPEPPENGRAENSAGIDTRLRLLAYEAAGRIVRKESQAFAKADKRYAGDDQGHREWADEFWAGHSKHISEALHVDLLLAHEYVAKHFNDRHADLELTTEDRTSALATMALGAETASPWRDTQAGTSWHYTER